MKKYILILLIFSSVISFSQTDDECYGVRLTHKITGKIYEFYLYNTRTIKLNGERIRVVITKFENDSLSLRSRKKNNGTVIWSEIEKVKPCEVKYFYVDGLFAKRLRPKYFHFEKFIIDDEKFCNPQTFNPTTTMPYP